MFLKEIETRPAEGVTKIALDNLRGDGGAIPEILHLFRFKTRSTNHLVRFTEEVMRGPSPLSPGVAGADRRLLFKEEPMFFLQ